MQLGGQLHLARSVGADDPPEVAAADVAVNRSGAEELRVIENVEGFGAKLERLAFCQRERLG